MAMPTKYPVKESWILAIEVSKSLAIAGNPGRYMSMEKGLIVQRAPNTKTILKYSFFEIFLSNEKLILSHQTILSKQV